MLLKKIYKGYQIFYYDIKYLTLAERIIDKKIKIVKKLKDTKRNFVVEIEFEEKYYVLKEARNEYRIPQRKLMTFFKKGEALTTLVNLHKLIYEKKIREIVEPYICICKRKNGMITYSALIMEKINGSIERKYLDKAIEVIKELHKNKIYHGDFNPSNFLVDEYGNIKIIDTQGKKMLFGNYRAHYDMLTMKMDSYREMSYPYKKNIFYYSALFVKKIKKMPFIEKIKYKKKILRDRGWKI